MSANPITVVAALIERDGCLLICQRRTGDALALKWEFPGGKVTPGETLPQALVRELGEELDVSAEIGELLWETSFTYGELNRTVHLHFFRATIPPASTPRNLAFETIEWAKPQSLPAYDFLPADKELVARIAQGKLRL